MMSYFQVLAFNPRKQSSCQDLIHLNGIHISFVWSRREVNYLDYVSKETYFSLQHSTRTHKKVASPPTQVSCLISSTTIIVYTNLTNFHAWYTCLILLHTTISSSTAKSKWYDTKYCHSKTDKFRWNTVQSLLALVARSCNYWLTHVHVNQC